jgi:putative methionine-R-sulfoxide reductase with GAF domain
MEPVGTNPPASGPEVTPIIGDRRRRARQGVHIPAYASLNLPAPKSSDLNEVLNISPEGVCIQTSSSLESKRRLSLCLDLSETQTKINTTGVVVWTDKSGRAGIYLPELGETSLHQLEQWLRLNSQNAGHAEQPVIPVSKPAPSRSDSSSLDVRGQNQRPPRNTANASPAASDYTSILSALSAVKREVQAIGPNLDASLQLIAERALTLTRGTGVAIALSQGNEMLCVARAGLDAPNLGTRIQVGSGFSGQCVRSGSLLCCDDSELDDRVDRESCRALGIRSIIAMPIRIGDAVMGLLEVFSPNARAFTARDNTVLRHLAEAVLLALNRAARVSPEMGNALKASVANVPHPAAEASYRYAPAKFTSTSKRILLSAVAATLMLAIWVISPWSGTLRLWNRSLQVSSAASAAVPAKPLSRAPATTLATDLSSLRKLAERGDPTAQFAMGARYATGQEDKQDYSEAMRWFSMAADRGHIVAQDTLGAYYWAGRGVPKDVSKAYFWSVLAQAGGNRASKYRVAALASLLTRSQILAAQEQAGEWLRHHQSSTKPAGDSE